MTTYDNFKTYVSTKLDPKTPKSVHDSR